MMRLETPEAEALFRDNQRLVGKVISRLTGRSGHRIASVGEDDLWQEGLIALVGAANGFDPSRGYTFSTYAVPRIELRVAAAIRASTLVAMPEYAHFAARRLSRLAVVMPGATDSELAVAARFPNGRIDCARAAERILSGGIADIELAEIAASQRSPLESLVDRECQDQLDEYERQREATLRGTPGGWRGKRREDSCRGPLLKEDGSGRHYEDMTGQKFDHLVVEGVAPQRHWSGSRLWHCRCKCGGTIDVLAKSLRAPSKHSCGCLRGQRRDLLPRDEPPALSTM